MPSTSQTTVAADRAPGQPRRAVIERWGLVPYEAALRRQAELHARRVAGLVPDTLVIVEHPPTFTLGRHAPEGDVLLDAGELQRRGIDLVRSDRGGRATYHGPGQVVLYPIVSIDDLGLGVKGWVCLLESALLETLADYGVIAERRPSTAGLWTRGGKIASVGLRVARGVSTHGVSLNTGLEPSVFDCIVTCGVRGERVTTIAAETGRRPDEAEVAATLASHILDRLASHGRPAATGSACEADVNRSTATKREP